jgi:hypothetical protein
MLLAVLVVVAAEVALRVVVAIGAALAAVRVRGWDPFRGAVFAFTGAPAVFFFFNETVARPAGE